MKRRKKQWRKERKIYLRADYDTISVCISTLQTYSSNNDGHVCVRVLVYTCVCVSACVWGVKLLAIVEILRDVIHFY